jgi:malonyl-CoA/methylmalonyl-CoA synthetase
MATAAMQKKVVLPRIPLFEAISKQPLDKIAVVHSASGKRFTYGSLLSDIDTTRARIAAVNNSSNSSSERGYDLKETRVALLVENGYEYVGQC